ncbi:MAG: hypothetical protein QXD53_07170 [Candidatus Bathyarchaeia archaeon]
MNQSISDESMSKLEFNPYCEVASLIRRKIRAKYRFPGIISLGGFNFPCKVYGGLTSLPVELNGRNVKYVWINDVIFRYLPYSIRMVRGKRHIVKEIKLAATKEGYKLKNIVMEDLGGFDLIEDDLKRQVHKTTSYVKVHVIATDRLSESPYQTIIVEYEPQYVNYVARREKEIYDEKSGLSLKIPVYYIISSYPVQKDLRDALRKYSRDFTRGFKLELKAPSEIVDAFSWLPFESNMDLFWDIIKTPIDEYAHLATHIILNRVVEKEKWNPRDVDHYVDSTINLDEELKQRLKEMLSRPADENEKRKRLIESLLPKISITVVVGSKADLLKGFNWNEIQLDDLEKLSSTDLESEVTFPRCPIKPDFVREDPTAPRIIKGLSKLLLEELKNAANKVKTY